MSNLPTATTSETHDFIPHENVWLEDGNLIFLATAPDSKVPVAFRVHAGVMMHTSMVLAKRLQAKLGLGSLEDLLNVDWNKFTTYITLDDHPVDVGYWLSAVYDGLGFDLLDKKRLATIRGVLLLAKKYGMDDLYAVAYHHLINDYPCRGSRWVERESRCRIGDQMLHPLDGFAHPIHAVKLARELDMPEILPGAYYDLTRYTLPTINVGTGPLAGGEHIPYMNEKVNRLSDRDFNALIPLKDFTFRYLRDICHIYLEERLQVENCEAPEKNRCKFVFSRVQEQIMRMMVGLPGGEKFRRADKNVVDPFLVFERMWVAVRQKKSDILAFDHTSGDPEPKPIVCCAGCAHELREVSAHVRRDLWLKIMEYVNLKEENYKAKYNPTPVV